jgi:hypothetical protein
MLQGGEEVGNGAAEAGEEVGGGEVGGVGDGLAAESASSFASASRDAISESCHVAFLA